VFSPLRSERGAFLYGGTVPLGLDGEGTVLQRGITSVRAIHFVLLVGSRYRNTRNMEGTSGTENGSSERCHRRTISGSSKNLSNQGSLKNNFHRNVFEEPIKVSQRTLTKWFFKAPLLVPPRIFQTRVL